jgi:hypothetical protein
MSVESQFTKTFGAKAPAAAGNKPKAQYWLNVGYSVDVQTEAGVEQRFVSLPTGIPLDTQEVLPTNSSNVDFAQFQAARNDLHDQIMALAGDLEPGEERTLKLEIQLRRVKVDKPVEMGESNVFVRKLSL